jgi:hypothetical protein
MTDLSLPLKQQLIATEGWVLQDLGFRVVGEYYDYKHFGNSGVELESEILRLRFVRDRGQTWAEVAPLSEPMGWWAMSWVLEAIRGDPPEPPPTDLEEIGRRWMEAGPRLTLQAEASLFRDNLAALNEALGPGWPKTKLELGRRYQLRVQESAAPRPIPLEARLRLVRRRWRRPAIFLSFAVAAATVLWIVLR